MTERYNALIVTLDDDYRSDDAIQVINAIKQLKGVISVRGNVSDMTAHIAQNRALTDIKAKLFNVLYDEEKRL